MLAGSRADLLAMVEDGKKKGGGRKPPPLTKFRSGAA
jgi:hypothetical protein